MFVYDVLMRCDGGVSNNSFLMQLISNLIKCDLDRPQQTDMTSLGAAFLAGLAAGTTATLSTSFRLQHSQQQQL